MANSKNNTITKRELESLTVRCSMAISSYYAAVGNEKYAALSNLLSLEVRGNFAVERKTRSQKAKQSLLIVLSNIKSIRKTFK